MFGMHQDMNNQFQDLIICYFLNQSDKVGKRWSYTDIRNTKIRQVLHFVRQSAHDIFGFNDLKGNHIKSRNRLSLGQLGKYCFHGLSLHGTFYNESSKPRIL